MSGRETLDALEQDMADHQRRFAGEVTGERNRSLMAGELERVDKMLAEAAARPQVAAAPPVTPVAPTITREERDGREYLLRKECRPDDNRPGEDPLVRVASPLEAEFLVLAGARVELLLSLPDSGPRGGASWRDRMLAVMSIKTKAQSWRAAADAPEQLAETRRKVTTDQALLKRLGLETISQLTPELCRVRAAECDRQYLAEFVQLLEDSNPLFGDWKNPPGPTIHIAAS